MKLGRQFEVIAMPGNVMIFCEPDDRASIVGNMGEHLIPGGRLVAGFSLEPGGYTISDWDEHCASSGFELEARYGTWSRDGFTPGGDYHVSVHRLTERPALGQPQL